MQGEKQTAIGVVSHFETPKPLGWHKVWWTGDACIAHHTGGVVGAGVARVHQRAVIHPIAIEKRVRAHHHLSIHTCLPIKVG